MARSSYIWRRCIGAVFLTVAVGMLVIGETFLKPMLNGYSFILFWTVCFAFTGLAVLTALLDFWIVRRQSREEKRELLNRTLEEIKKEQKNSSEK